MLKYSDKRVSFNNSNGWSHLCMITLEDAADYLTTFKGVMETIPQESLKEKANS